jgi:hypothetical protein
MLKFFGFGKRAANSRIAARRSAMAFGEFNAFRMPVLCATAALVFSIVAGCGQRSDAKPTGKVHGKVMVSGNPLTQGRINFNSDKLGAGAGGDIKPDGTYSLDGPLPLGEYKVFVSFDIAPSQRGTPAENVLKSVPAKYLAAASSGLSAEVKTGTTESNFDLD